MNSEQKSNIVNDLNGQFHRVNAAYLTTFTGLKVIEMDALRNKIRSAGGKFRVIKNTLARLGTKDTPFEALAKGIKGSVGWAYTEKDPVALAKVLKDFQKEKETFSFSQGILDGKSLNVEQIKALAEMPSREILMAQILGVLNGPARNLVSVIQAVPRQLVTVIEAIRKKKQEEESKNG